MLILLDMMILRETWNVILFALISLVVLFPLMFAIRRYIALGNNNNIMFVLNLNRSMFRNSICTILLFIVYRIEFTIAEQPFSYDHQPIFHYSWFIHFIKNLTDYFFVIIPVGLLVFLSKQDLLPSYSRCQMIFHPLN